MSTKNLSTFIKMNGYSCCSFMCTANQCQAMASNLRPWPAYSSQAATSLAEHPGWTQVVRSRFLCLAVCTPCHQRGWPARVSRYFRLYHINPWARKGSIWARGLNLYPGCFTICHVFVPLPAFCRIPWLTAPACPQTPYSAWHFSFLTWPLPQCNIWLDLQVTQLGSPSDSVQSPGSPTWHLRLTSWHLAFQHADSACCFWTWFLYQTLSDSQTWPPMTQHDTQCLQSSKV